MGQYTLAILAFGGAAMVPTVVAQLTYPRMGLAYGQAGDVYSLRSLVISQSVACVLVTLPVVIMIWIAPPLLLPG